MIGGDWPTWNVPRVSMCLWIACGLSHIRKLNRLCPRSSGISLRLRGEHRCISWSRINRCTNGARIRTDTLTHWNWNYFIRITIGETDFVRGNSIVRHEDSCAAKHLEMLEVNNTCSRLCDELFALRSIRFYRRRKYPPLNIRRLLFGSCHRQKRK